MAHKKNTENRRTMPPSLQKKKRTKKWKKPQTLLRKGSKVEVRSDEEGFRGVWYAATILELSMSKHNKQKGKVFIRYNTLLAEDQSPLTGYVCPSTIRPLSPVIDGFEVNDAVEAFHLDGWWEGVVTSVREENGERKYMVVFDDPPDQIEFFGVDVRAHLDWTGEKWVKPPKQYRMKGLEFSKGMTVEVNLQKGRPKHVWFQAVILDETGFNSFWVEFSVPGNDNERKKKGPVDSFNIRPPHPIFMTKKFELLDKVCVFHGLARKEGFVTDILADGSYLVYLKGEKISKKFPESKLMPYLQYTDRKWIGRHFKDGISSCIGGSECLVKSKERSPSVTVQLESPDSEHTQVLEQDLCTTSCTNQLNVLTTCKKLDGEKSSELSSSAECNDMSTSQTPLERSNGENSPCCVLAKCSSNPIPEDDRSVESTCDSKKESHEEEARMEDGMMTSAEKSEAQQNSELKVQLVSASGGTENGKGDLAEKDASLVPFCQGKTNAAIQLEGASGLDNEEQEKGPSTNSCENSSNYSASSVSEFLNKKRRADKSEVECSSPCKKFRGETNGTVPSSAEFHGRSTPIERLNVGNITIPVLFRYLRKSQIGKFSPVESTDTINTGAHEEEARMESDMITSVDKSGEPGNSEFKEQKISASGAEENTANYMATGKNDNDEGALLEMLTPQFATDYMVVEVNMVDVGTNCDVKSGETSAPLVTQHCMEKITTDDVAAENISVSCGSSTADKQSQLCLEGGNDDRNMKSAATSTPLSATICLTKDDNIVGMAKDSAEYSNGISSIHQSQFLFLEGHSSCDIQNQCNDTVNGKFVSGTESPVRSVEVNNEPIENVEMPFVKTSPIWKSIDSLKIFKRFPQKPHFRSLMNTEEAFREGFAVGYTMTFSSMMEKISELRVTDSREKFNNCLEILAELEIHGFRVKPAMDRVNALLSIKDGRRQLEDQSVEVKAQIAERSRQHVRLNASIRAIDMVQLELQKERQMYVSLEKNCIRHIDNLQQEGVAIDEGISAADREFESLVAASW